MCHLLWNSPDDDKTEGWSLDSRRAGIGYRFGRDITERWNHENGCKLLISGQDLVLEGYEWKHNKQCLCLWTAPHYKQCCGNKAAMMELDDKGDYIIHQFNIAWPHRVREEPLSYDCFL